VAVERVALVVPMVVMVAAAMAGEALAP